MAVPCAEACLERVKSAIFTRQSWKIMLDSGVVPSGPAIVLLCMFSRMVEPWLEHTMIDLDLRLQCKIFCLCR